MESDIDLPDPVHLTEEEFEMHFKMMEDNISDELLLLDDLSEPPASDRVLTSATQRAMPPESAACSRGYEIEVESREMSPQMYPLGKLAPWNDKKIPQDALLGVWGVKMSL